MELSEIVSRIRYRLAGRVVHLKAQGTSHGSVLVCYTTLPFLNKNPKTLEAHSNRWEALEMTNAFLEQGYDVDVVDITNKSFVPAKHYAFCIDNSGFLERASSLLNPECVRVAHLSTAYWEVNNAAEETRLRALEKRRGIALPHERILRPDHGIELCHEATLLGNTWTESTYAFAKKPITRIGVSTTHTYPSPEKKDFAAAHKNFIWFGGAGLVHKGLDIVLEAFAAMPDLFLTVMGKINPEEPFARAYKQELYETPNIKTLGWKNPGSEEFKRISEESIALVYPSCSEGQAGSVILGMHAGLIPVVSRESGVDTGSFGITLKENTIEQIQAEVRALAALPVEKLREQAMAAWQEARTHHVREAFAKNYRAFVAKLIQKQQTN